MAEIFGVLGILCLFGMIGSLVSDHAPAAGIFLLGMTVFFGGALILGRMDDSFLVFV